jgi:hypothetical protein
MKNYTETDESWRTGLYTENGEQAAEPSLRCGNACLQQGADSGSEQIAPSLHTMPKSK